MSKTTQYTVHSVRKRQMGDGYDMELTHPTELDEDGEPKWIGGFTYVGDGLPPVEGGTVAVMGTLGTGDCIIEWDRGRLVGVEYETK